MENDSLRSCPYMFGLLFSFICISPNMLDKESKSRRSLEAVRYNPGHTKERKRSMVTLKKRKGNRVTDRFFLDDRDKRPQLPYFLFY